jgi:tetratricopeptide (TPR) repeat protein
VTVSKWLAAAALAAGTALGAGGPATAAEPATPVYGFGTLKAVQAADARAKVEAWLKAADKFDQAKFDEVWSNDGRPVLDRTVDAILLGLPEAAPALAAARDPAAPAPTEVPAVIRDQKDPFVKANLAAAYAKALTGRKVYEEALDALKGIEPEKLVDPAGFYFHKAVAEHALIQREAAISSLARLLDDVPDAPDRYRIVATLMFFDLQNWAKDEKDLSNITRLMDNSGRRLELARGGPQTQEIQKKIVFRLDEKIKELENRARQQPGGS